MKCSLTQSRAAGFALAGLGLRHPLGVCPGPGAKAAPAALIRLYELLKNDSRSSLQAPLRVPSDRTGQRTPLPGGLSRKWACADRFVALGGECGLGGGERDRTDDPLLAKQVLSQLSYTPLLCVCALWWVWLDSNQRPPPYQDGALTD